MKYGISKEDLCPTTLRIISYNILYGQRWTRCRDLLRANPADVICLQEVPEPNHRWRNVVRPSEIVEDLDMPHDLAMLWFCPGKRVGNMTLVRGRIDAGIALHTRTSMPYGLLNCVEVGDARLHVANVHMAEMFGPPAITFSFSEVLRMRETLHLTRLASATNAPFIACGDFNTFWPAPATWPMRRLWRDCRLAVGAPLRATRRTYGLPFVIDHIFVRGDVDVVDYAVIDGGGSDHQPVSATLRVRSLSVGNRRV